MLELPAHMTKLQSDIRAGLVSAQDALRAQVDHGRALNTLFPCVVEELAVSAPGDGPLAGIALAHKDIFQRPDHLPGCGLGPGLQQAGVAPAAALDALQRAGASQWATLVMTPHACGATSQNPYFSPCINPLDADAAVGGSSSGCAVAVAAGMVYASLGTDTAGSVRIPAATCGLLGLKTTHGAVSTQGCAPLAPSLDSIGILSRYAQDARQILAALCPHLPSKETPHAPRCRLWIPANRLAPELAQAMRAWAGQLQGDVTPVDMSEEFELLSRHAQRVLLYETARTHHATLLNGTAEPGVKALGLMGLGLPHAWYQDSIQVRAGLLQDFVQRHFNDAQFLILPTLAGCVPDWQTVAVGHTRFQRAELLDLHHYMGFVNYLGLPSLNLPIAHDARGRPVSVQVLARPFAEHQLLDLADNLAPIFWTH